LESLRTTLLSGGWVIVDEACRTPTGWSLFHIPSFFVNHINGHHYVSNMNRKLIITYVIDHIDECTKSQRMCVLELVEQSGEVKLSSAKDGSRCNMDLMSMSLLQLIHDYVKLYTEIPEQYQI
jgi:hypothetical protein